MSSEGMAKRDAELRAVADAAKARKAIKDRRGRVEAEARAVVGKAFVNRQTRRTYVVTGFRLEPRPGKEWRAVLSLVQDPMRGPVEVKLGSLNTAWEPWEDGSE